MKMTNDEAIDAIVVVLEQDRGDYHLSQSDLDKALNGIAMTIDIIKKRQKQLAKE